MSQSYTPRVLGNKTVFERIWGFPRPQWVWDMALEFRLPGLFCAYLVYKNSVLYYNSLSAYQPQSSWGMTKGTLLDLRKLTYRHIAVPRYAVTYEFDVDGVKYTSTRATTGSPYRNWMRFFYNDTITEAQYLQAMPILRKGEKCTVFYNKSNPSAHSGLAHDANSWEISLLAFCAAMPILMGYYMKAQCAQAFRDYFPRKLMKIRFPKVDHPKPPPPPPRQPTQISPIPKE